MLVRAYCDDDGLTRAAVVEDLRGNRLWSAWDYAYRPPAAYAEAARRWAIDHGHQVAETN